MATFTKRRGRHVVDYRDATGRRRVLAFATRAEVEDYADREGIFSRRRGRLRPILDPKITVAAYARRWLERQEQRLRPRAYEAHAMAVALYIAPRLGHWRVTELRRMDVIDFLTDCLREGASGRPLKPGSVRLIKSALCAMLNAAFEEQLVASNVAARLGRRFRFHPTRQERQASVEERVLQADERRRLFARTLETAELWYPLFLTYDRAGLRLGEAIALRIDDVRFATGKLHVTGGVNERSGERERPKTTSRLVDLSPELARVLSAHITKLKRHALRTGRPLGEWLFPSRTGGLLGARNVRRALARVATRAGLGHVTPHDLRHTFGSSLIAAGESMVYVQKQMGHASIQITVDTYGSALPITARHGVALLDGYHEAAGPEAPAAAAAAPEMVTSGNISGVGTSVAVAQRAEKLDEPSRDRTGDPLLKSQVSSARSRDHRALTAWNRARSRDGDIG
jgi:integrase